jgi:hypothetical protein
VLPAETSNSKTNQIGNKEYSDKTDLVAYRKMLDNFHPIKMNDFIGQILDA